VLRRITLARSKYRPTVSISETPSTQTFDNTLVDFPVLASAKLRDSVTSSASSASQQRQTENADRHFLPDTVTSTSSTNQRRRNEMLEYFAVRRPQVKQEAQLLLTNRPTLVHDDVLLSRAAL